MGILVNKGSRVIVQGITGREGANHARAMREFGTQVVAGVTPGKGGQDFEGWPVYNSVAEAKENSQRALLVPATMRLLGDWNWWLPSGLRRFVPERSFVDESH